MSLKTVFAQAFFIASLLAVSFSSKAQLYKEYVPPTPTAAALGKYVDMPVNLSTGTPEINIPLYEIKCGSLTLPISLNYHAGGFRVEEQATWVGLGWSLIAGGAITRTILDKEDIGNRHNFFNAYDGVLFNKTNLYNYPYRSTNSAYGYDYLTYFAQGDVNTDGVPDMHHYNFNGKSGKFVVIDGVVKLLPKQPLDVSVNSAIGTSITDEAGYIYIFGAVETTKTGPNASEIKTSNLLTQIISPTQDTINLEYLPTEFIQDVRISENKKYVINIGGRWTLQGSEFVNSISYVKGWELSKIKFNQGEVIFESTLSRDDILKDNKIGGRKLDGIRVLDKKGELVKHYLLNYSYFDSSPSGNSIDPDDKRLKLLGIDDLKLGTSYSFSYEENIKLPNKKSKAQDHWGYFNNRNNLSLVPEINTDPNCFNGYDFFKPNREPDTIAVKANLLKQIVYPTGGLTKFEFEAHDYYVEPYIKKTIPGSVVSVAAYQNVIWNSNYPQSTNHEEFSSIISISKKQCVQLSLNIQEYGIVEKKFRPYVSVFLSNGGVNDFEIAKYFLGDNPDQYIELDPGNYYLKAYASYNGCIANGSLTFDPTPPTYISKKWAGGVRVKRIEQFTSSHPSIIKHYKYNLGGDSNISSGILFAEPDYLSKSYEYTIYQEPCIYNEKTYEVITSNSRIMLGVGNHVSYKEVSEQIGEGKANGETISLFSTDSNINNNGNFDQTWRRGRLLEKKIYNANGTIITRVKNKYSYHTSTYEQFYTFQASILGSHPCSPDPFNPINNNPRHFSQSSSVIVSEFPYLQKSTEITYSGTDSIVNTTEYFYDNVAHLQPTRVVSTSGNPSLLKVTATTYPLDYPDNSGFIKNLKDAHFVALPIEQVVYQQNLSGSDQKILSGSLTTYKPGNLLGLKDQVWDLRTSYPISYQQFKFSNKAAGFLPNTGTNTAFAKDSRYRLDYTIDSYDLQNRPSQITKEDDQPSALVWSKNGEYLLAQVTNAHVNQVYHTSFEDNGTLDANAKTGERVHVGNVYIPAGKQPIAGNYLLTYWEWINNAWQYKQQTIAYQPGSSPLITTSNKIDEVRLMPAGARMTTYTYKPLVGNTSVCDQNNIVTYYFYDQAGRLSHTKDDKGNVLQKYEYKYASQ